MSSARRRLLGNVLIYGVSGGAVLALLVLMIIAWPQPSSPTGQLIGYWMLPIMAVGIGAAHAGSRVKATART
jgi:hypothetical protein